MNVHNRNATRAPETAGRIGPNAVLQLIEALREQADADLTERIFASVDLTFLLSCPPTTMVDERIPARLFAALWRELPAKRAQRIAAEAGRRTADYIIANRIPDLAKSALGLSPPWLATALLLSAIEKHAWTFAGSGRCSTHLRPTVQLIIEDNPMAMPDCCWHVAVFEQLFRRLVSPDTKVTHSECCRAGAEACRFDIDVLWQKEGAMNRILKKHVVPTAF